jgi:hypothetical protein
MCVEGMVGVRGKSCCVARNGFGGLMEKWCAEGGFRKVFWGFLYMSGGM